MVRGALRLAAVVQSCAATVSNPLGGTVQSGLVSELARHRARWLAWPSCQRRAWAAVALPFAVAAAVWVTAGASAASTTPERITASPAIGAPESIFAVHYVADAGDDSEGVEVDGPSGTPCAGTLVAGSFRPVNGNGGPVTLHIGPGADERYLLLAEAGAYDPAEQRWNGDRPLERWCPGTYTGQIWSGGYGQGVLEGTFEFVVSASGRATPGPAVRVQRHLRPVTVFPGAGGINSIFAVHYRADAPVPAKSGDVVQVDGPKGSSCAGSVIRELAYHTSLRGGPLTLHLGPHAQRKYGEPSAYDPRSPNADHASLRHWCDGAYTGRIWLENYASFVLKARFQLSVTAHRQVP